VRTLAVILLAVNKDVSWRQVLFWLAVAVFVIGGVTVPWYRIFKRAECNPCLCILMFMPPSTRSEMEEFTRQGYVK